MNERVELTAESLPRLAPHMRLRHDTARGVWTIQAPERSFMLDENAHAVISRCDGVSSITGIVDRLCVDFPDAPREVIETDVTTLLQNLADKGVITV